jgi:hypothetical protein
LHDRYLVFKTVEPKDNKTHEDQMQVVKNCFVLKYDTDPTARLALEVYARNMERLGETDFALDIYELLDKYKTPKNKSLCPVCGSSDYIKKVKEFEVEDKTLKEELYNICQQCGNLFLSLT